MQHRRNSRALKAISKAFWSWLWLAWLVQGFAANVDVTVGDARIFIPAPRDCIPIVPGMTNLTQFLDARTAPSNLRLASFVSEAAPVSGLNHISPEDQRILSVQTLKSSVGTEFSITEFNGIRDALRKQNDAAVQGFEARFPGALVALSNDVHAALVANPGLRSVGNITLPIEDDTSNCVAFSSIVNFISQRSGGVPQQHAGIVTSTLLLVNGKIVYLYGYGGETDLRWSREISKEWAAAIANANQSQPAGSERLQ